MFLDKSLVFSKENAAEIFHDNELRKYISYIFFDLVDFIISTSIWRIVIRSWT
jgi:hypothetical protein